MAKAKLQGRIRYQKDWNGDGEYFIFENKWTNEPDDAWWLECAFPLVSYSENGELIIGKGDLINCEVLGQIKKWRKLGIDFYFA